tara:strand:+ start:352 stop:2349 length:1998 start_codon:yes stop_codon:yes gene_type:complete
MSSFTKLNYRAEIDGLRAFAVLSVVIYHFFPGLINGGFIGVDIFFVISGFLITKNIFETLNENSFNILEFFGRRIRRIFPALLLVMIGALVIGFFILFNNEYTQLNKHVASGSVFIANFIFNNESGYFDNEAITKPMLHLWSLAVEEQFYIIWPLLLWFAWKQKLNLLIITFLIFFISLYYNIQFYQSNPISMFYLPFGRIWELLSGSILAWCLVNKKIQIKKLKDRVNANFIISRNANVSFDIVLITKNFLSFFGLLLLVFSITHINQKLIYLSSWTLIPVIGTLFIILAGNKSYISRVFLMNPISVWFGLISYPLYLLHWPVLSFLHIALGEQPDTTQRFYLLIISIFLAWITYRFIEKPIRNNKNKYFKTSILGLLMLILFIVSLLIYKNNSSIIISTPKQSVAATAVSSPMRKKCHFNLSRVALETLPVCKYIGSKIQVAVFGNSHSVELAYGIAEELQSSDVGIVHHTMSGCKHNYGMRNELEKINKDDPKKLENSLICTDWHDKVVKSILSNNDLDTVIVSYRNEWYLEDNNYSSSLAKMLNDLAKSKKNVILVLQAPYIDRGIRPKMLINDYIRKYVYFHNANITHLKLREWKDKYDAINNLLSKLPDNVKIYDPADKFCDSINCYIIKDGKALYFDIDHMSMSGVKLISNDIIQLID